MINKTILSIYNKPWLIEPEIASSMLMYWEQVKADGKEWDQPKVKSLDALQKFFAANNSVTVAPSSSYSMDEFEGFEGAKIAVIPISGALMKDDYCGALGMNTIRSLVAQANESKSVMSILFLIDSPGGTVDGTQSLASAIKASPKRTICVVDGMMASAGYWVGSSCDEVYASNQTDTIGSIGVMMRLVDRSEQMKKSGVVVRDYYATASGDKNAATNDAIKGEGKKLISEQLDPLADVFLSTVKNNRSGKLSQEENVLTGKMYMADKAVEYGLVDGIRSVENVISSEMSIRKLTKNINVVKSNNMTASEIKSQFPQAAAEIEQAAIASERDRVGAWMVYQDADPETVKTGVTSGATLGQTQMAEFAMKMHSKATLGRIKEDNAGAVQTELPAKPKSEEQVRYESLESELMKNLGLQ